MNSDPKNKPQKKAEYWDRFCYNSARKAILIVLLLAVIVVVIILSDFKPFTLNRTEEEVEKINDLILTLACGYIASFIFFLVQDFLPHLRYRESNRSYVKSQIGAISSLLRNEVERQFFFEISDKRETSDKKERHIDRYIAKFADDDLFSPIKELGGKSRYDVLRDDEKRIQEIAHELLRQYGSYLSYDEMKQLEYLNERYKIDPFLSKHNIELNGDVKIDDRFTRAQAVVIYKAYDIMRQQKFNVPHYPIEDELKQEFDLTNNNNSHHDMS